MSNDDRTIADMTPEQQIERLVRQRNALWRIINEFVSDFAPTTEGSTEKDDWVRDDEDGNLESADVSFDAEDGSITVRFPVVGAKLREVRIAAERLFDEAEEVVENPYVFEGYNPRTGERYDKDDARMPKGFEPYLRSAGEPWWR